MTLDTEGKQLIRSHKRYPKASITCGKEKRVWKGDIFDGGFNQKNLPRFEYDGSATQNAIWKSRTSLGIVISDLVNSDENAT
jgi:hypothetical protein